MVTEDYVSFETAKLLKEKGFDGICHKVWESHGDSTTLVEAAWFVEGETVVNRELVDTAAKRYAEEYNPNYTVDGYLAPTLQMAMKWLRETHNMHIEVKYFFEPRIYKYTITYTPIALDNISSHPQCFNTYEESCEAAIKYCLEKLI